jgi:hypothetical protein
MKRPPIFPQDWIAPREFHFCHCGKYLTLKSAKDDKHVEACGFCKTKHLPDIKDCYGLGQVKFFDFDLKARELRKEALELHEKLSNERTELAAKRKAEGVPPVFWVEGYAESNIIKDEPKDYSWEPLP